MRIISKHDGYTRDGIRRVYKGGGDPGAAAAQQEAERQARIQAATDEINRIFNNQQKATGTRYVKQNTGIFGANQAPEYIDAAEYERRKNAYGQAMQKATGGTGSGQPRSGRNFLGGGYEDSMAYRKQYGDGQDAGDGLDYSKLTPDEIALVQSFNPGDFQQQSYQYWVPGDPANSREKLYTDQRTAVFDLNKREVDRQATEAERINRFGLARAGLLGGSVNVDSVADINRRTNEGLLKAGGLADGAAADLRAADERTRSNLISMAQSGIDTGSAASLALNGLKSNAESAAGARAGSTIGGLFNDLSQAYLANQQIAGSRAGMGAQGATQQWYGVSSPTQRYQGATA